MATIANKNHKIATGHLLKNFIKIGVEFMKTLTKQLHNLQTSANANACVFCNLDRSNSNEYWVGDLEYGSLLLNYNQSYMGRCIYVPFSHFDSLKQIDSKSFEEFNKEVFFLSKILEDACESQLINIAILGNKVRHIHWHLIPRYKNDPNWGQAPWPTKTTKIGREDLERLKSRIREHLEVLV